MNAYDAKDYELLYSLASEMSADRFLKDLKRDQMSLVHLCAIDDNADALERLCQLPYIQDIVNDDSNDDGWTPLL